ncbi:putative TOS1-like glycosyl hydrolase-domain-containing protein [Neohortaea acidophila]|uniref:glucan endo-1,3-beta-D-glucosidase n=1 Tax=Neohortaea acidophila TaxID=245834 RepID=A0A6A6PT98_9PEZI|nr:putative TOS1-like glycosyl hydrolase-domain-containing protein [Neohortaea acidophila]KAF2482457.1 putative TOS1-like glycosyl hydrolase-domain-containing protein [Neohortaea acidophila]
MAFHHLFAAAALLATIASAQDSQGCSSPTLFEGNYYCSKVDAITYTGVGGTGSYNRVTDMPSSGSCSSSPSNYSGSLSPLDQEVSLHMRGPFQLLEFAAYSPGGPVARKAKRSDHIHRHAHHHARGVRARGVGDWVTATIDGEVVSWINEYNGGAAPTASSGGSASASTSTSTTAGTNNPAPLTSSTPSTGSSPQNWTRQAYYDAATQTSQGLVFLNHYGGTGSGVFDYVYGNSLSYSSEDGTTGASSPQTLASTTLPSSAEVVIMTDSQCGAQDTDCGYYRPGTVAYHGFNGPAKAFFFSFQMPNEGGTSADIYDPINMPALWMLNALIPRTLQYGSADCSCWTSGCGEFDIFEVLTSGYHKAKSTLHGNVAGGSSYWFRRPEEISIKLGVVLFDDNIHVKVLDADTDFDEDVSGVIEEIIQSTMADSGTVTLFRLAGAGSG